MFQSLVSILAQTAPSTGGSEASSNLVCQLFPFLSRINFFGISQFCSGQNLDRRTAAQEIGGVVSSIVSLIFVAIIIVAVYIIIKAAIKYIRSEGDESKIQEAQKAIKSVFIGLVALFVGIIGLILILVLFNALGAVENQNPLDELESLPE